MKRFLVVAALVLSAPSFAAELPKDEPAFQRGACVTSDAMHAALDRYDFVLAFGFRDDDTERRFYLWRRQNAPAAIMTTVDEHQLECVVSRGTGLIGPRANTLR